MKGVYPKIRTIFPRARKSLLTIVGIALTSLLFAYLFLLPSLQPSPAQPKEPTKPEFPTGKTLTIDLDGIRVRLIEIRDCHIGGDTEIKGVAAYIYVERLVIKNVASYQLEIKKQLMLGS